MSQRGFKCDDRILKNCTVLLGILFSLVLCGVGLYNMIFVSKAFTPSCAKEYERVCNGRGVCGPGGICICDTLYSNSTCVDNYIPGYDLVTNKECNGNGYAYPFINVPSQCAQYLLPVEPTLMPYGLLC
jgi:hypothetical protein